MSENNEENLDNSKKQLKKELNEKMNKVVFKNIIIAIVIIIYFMFLNLGYYNIQKSNYITDLQVFSASILTIAIILFEKSYSKDNEGIFLNGIEALIVAIITLVMPSVAFGSSEVIHYILSFSFIYFAIYYAIKSFFQAKKIKKEYKISDVREIVKK